MKSMASEPGLINSDASTIAKHDTLKMKRIAQLWTSFDYIITQVIHGFWLVLAYDLLEDRRTIDVTISFYANKV